MPDLIAFAVVGCRWGLVVVFAAAGIGKLSRRASMAAVAGVVRDLSPLPARLAVPTAWAVAVAEILAAILLLVPGTALIGYGLAGTLAAAFGIVTVIGLSRGLRPPCPCFGSASFPLRARHVVRDMGLMTAAGLGAAGHGSSLPLPGLVTAGFAATILAIAVIYLDELFDLFAKPRPG